MYSSFRRFSQSKAGGFVLVLFLLLILASFALTDLSSMRNGGFGLGSNTLAKAGTEQVTDRDMGVAMERLLSQARQQNPEADYSSLANDFEPLLNSLIEERALKAFATDHGFFLSKRLVDAEIAQIPATRGLDGKFSEQSYAQFLSTQRLTDTLFRRLVEASILQKLILAPVATTARVPVGVAKPYASMLLEQRDGEFAAVPVAMFRAGLTPTDAQLQQYYAQNQKRYMVPEQRVMRYAEITQATLGAIAPTDQEIAAYYKANSSTYAAKESRVLSQAVVPDAKAAQAIAAKLKSGASFVDAAKPAGLSAADISLGPQTRDEFVNVAGEKIAASAFGAASGAIIGPIQSDLGWHVIKVESISREGGKSLSDARAEIVAKLADQKRQTGMADLVADIQDSIDDGASFAEVVAKHRLTATSTPALTGNGTARSDPSYRLPANLAPALKTAFELEVGEDPVVDTLADKSGSVLVDLERKIASAPEPLAQIRNRVGEDWITEQATAKARVAAQGIADRVAKGMAMAEAIKASNSPVPPPERLSLRRMDLAQMGNRVPSPIRMLFTMGQGKSRMVAVDGGTGFAVVRVVKITPGDASNNPSLIAQTRSSFQQTASQEYAEQFLAAIRKDQGVVRNEEAIRASKQRITGSN